MAKLTGGGIQSSVNKKVGIRGGKASARIIDPAGLSQLGAAQGSRLSKSGSYLPESSAKQMFRGSKPNPVAFGNALSTNVGKGAPGAGRTVMRSGSQSLHGSVAGPAPVQGREILGSFGPETTSRASLVHKR
jgi:hypothetical protein